MLTSSKFHAEGILPMLSVSRHSSILFYLVNVSLLFLIRISLKIVFRIILTDQVVLQDTRQATMVNVVEGRTKVVRGPHAARRPRFGPH